MLACLAAPNVDYVDLNGTVLTFGLGDDIACFSITVINDNIIEDEYNEFFTISLSIQAADNFTFIGAQMATFRIVDDEEGKGLPLLL